MDETFRERNVFGNVERWGYRFFAPNWVERVKRDDHNYFTENAGVHHTLKTEVLGADEGEVRRMWSGSGMKGQGKLEITGETRRPAASSGAIPICENPGATPNGIEYCSHRWEASSLTTKPQWSLFGGGASQLTLLALKRSPPSQASGTHPITGVFRKLRRYAVTRDSINELIHQLRVPGTGAIRVGRVIDQFRNCADAWAAVRGARSLGYVEGSGGTTRWRLRDDVTVKVLVRSVAGPARWRMPQPPAHFLKGQKGQARSSGDPRSTTAAISKEAAEQFVNKSKYFKRPPYLRPPKIRARVYYIQTTTGQHGPADGVSSAVAIIAISLRQHKGNAVPAVNRMTLIPVAAPTHVTELPSFVPLVLPRRGGGMLTQSPRPNTLCVPRYSRLMVTPNFLDVRAKVLLQANPPPHENKFETHSKPVFRVDKIDIKHVYTEVDFVTGSQFMRHALDDSEPIADLQGNNLYKDRELFQNITQIVDPATMGGMKRRVISPAELSSYICSVIEATVAERLACSPPTKDDPGSIHGRVAPDSRMSELCRTMPLVGGFPRGSPVSPALSFRSYSILTSITLTGSRDLNVKSSPNLFILHSPVVWNSTGMKRGGGTGYLRENPPTSGIVRHDIHLRKSGVTLPGIEPGSPLWEAGRANVTLGAAPFVIGAADQESWRWVCPAVVNRLLELDSSNMNNVGISEIAVSAPLWAVPTASQAGCSGCVMWGGGRRGKVTGSQWEIDILHDLPA
ncbi:hypothetical protein PR048_027323 [Dryococelus australis]|uniref:Uncharacterized protein n=1 Tax=Dryococelus australis TaxID=614101 RepID=A0ABQ9GF55_9NEOP|nr:hypothetical protein PR048_027323 [Dryococelus australis]